GTYPRRSTITHSEARLQVSGRSIGRAESGAATLSSAASGALWGRAVVHAVRCWRGEGDGGEPNVGSGLDQRPRTNAGRARAGRAAGLARPSRLRAPRPPATRTGVTSGSPYWRWRSAWGV